MTAKTQHARPGREPDEHRLHARRLPEHRRVGQLRAGHASARTCPRSSPSPTRAACRRPAPNNWGSGFLPAVFQGTPFNADKPIPNLAPPAGDHADADRRRHARLPEAAQRRAPRSAPRRHRAGRPHRQLRAGRADAAQRAARSADLSQRAGRTSCDCTAPTTPNNDQGRLRPQLPARPAAARARRALRAALQRRLRDGRGRRQLGRPQDAQDAVRRPRPDPRPAVPPPCSRDLKQRGLLDDTLVVWVTEFGRMPTFQKGASGRDHNPKGFTVWLAGAGVKTRVQLRRDRRVRLQGGRERRHDLRPPRHDPAPARPRPRAPQLLPQRHRAPADRRPRASHPRAAFLRVKDDRNE